MLAAPLAYIYKAAQARAERVANAFLFLVVLGPVLYAVQGILLAVGQVQVADQFVAQEAGVGDIYSLATNLLEDSGPRTAAIYVYSVATIAIIFGMVYTCLWGVQDRPPHALPRHARHGARRHLHPAAAHRA